MRDDLDFDMGFDGNGSGNEDVLEEITNMESKFYQEGYQAGYDHGQLHGLFEGRELGKEKAWELWEEIGFYEGFAQVYISLLGSGGKGVEGSKRGKDARALSHAQILLSAISTFPTYNPSQPTTSTIPQDGDTTASELTESAEMESTNRQDKESEFELSSLTSNIRARYKLLCSSLNVKPRLQNAQFVEVQAGSGAGGATNTVRANGNGIEGVQEGIEWPIKGVDTRQLRF
ncbi:uncharacterized protein I303_106680 [Kwoniella dejecticola CBS 10117]|uniref:Essential protein Yae1 N-terminal domain-containing protein n=1 Tax=Kwoniella dejecticola CBS 10117 TaxID=1296121 RepID=A0A1A5ZU00_9TREE|nr:uncharacterized protein I303_08677 [Kwoniella dejecticola CBS 10117]OBR81291.1 hypothetical protein I303_08677 [Kwoniella dejecticola CBS 10117]